jgi:DnaJ-domain-containing protein 1
MKLEELYSGSWSHINFKPIDEELPEHYKEEYFYDDSNYYSDPFENPFENHWDPPKPFGLKRSASDEEIKKKYRELILKHHPDKGGDEEKFKSVQAEWENYQYTF